MGGGRLAVLAAVAGTFAGSMVWDRIRLPFPAGAAIVGDLLRSHRNPLDHLAGFILTLILAATGLLLARRLTRTRPSPPTTVPEDPSTPSHRRAVFGFGMALVLTVALSVPTYHASGALDTFHEGEALAGGACLQKGLTPYRDFQVGHGMIQDAYRPAWAFSLWGRSIASARTLESLLKVLAFLLAASFFFRIFHGRPWRALAALSVLMLLHRWCVFRLWVEPLALGLEGGPDPGRILRLEPLFRPFEFVLIHTRDIPFWIWMHLVLLATGSSGKGPPRRVFLLSAAMGYLPLAAMAYSFERGMALSAGWAVFGLLWALTGRSRAVILAGSAAGIAAGLASLGALSGWDPRLFGHLLETLRVYPWIYGSAHFPVLRWPYLPALFMTVLGLSWWLWCITDRALPSMKERLKAYPVETALLAVALASWGAVLERPDLEHLNGSFTPALCLSLVFLMRSFAVGTLTAKAGRVLRVGTMSLAAVMLASGLLSMVRNDALALNFPLGTPDESFIPSDYRAALGFFRGRLGPSETIWVMTDEPFWYYALDLVPPAGTLCTNRAATPEAQREVIRSLETKGVRFVLWRNKNWSNSMDRISMEERLPILAQSLRANFRPYRVLDGQEVWMRKGAIDASARRNGR